MAVKNKVQLITYPDSLGGNLQTLNYVLETYFPGLFAGGVHILPPFPSSGDRGFAPLTYLEIAPGFGTWEDIRQIAEKHDILLDLMVNHISAKSKYFRDFLKKGRESAYAELFLTLDKIWPRGEIPAKDFEKIFLRREQPYSEFRIGKTKEVEKVWTTFGKTDPSEQIDLDVHSNKTRKLLKDFMENFSRNHVGIVRLDAVGYVIKKPSTTFFFVEPEIYEFLDWIEELANSLEIEILPEVHAHYTTQNKLAQHGYWIYDFILPYMVLDTLFNQSSKKLLDYLKDRPSKQFTMLDCHDGIPIKPDLNDIYESENARKIVDICLERGGNLSLIKSPKHRDADGFDVHQIRGTIYSLLGCDDNAYLAARAIQFFAPGVPQVYYMGMLAGENDLQALEESSDGRVINRRNYSLVEVEHEMQKEVVRRLVKLIQFRNRFPAFDGDFHVLPSEPDEVRLEWRRGQNRCTLKIDLKNYQTVIDYIEAGGEQKVYRV
jgi:sucrose phosphorylase